MTDTAYYSLLRWRADPARDEARNIAVILCGDGSVGAFRAAPISSISKSLKDQGLLDRLLHQFEQRFTGPDKLTVEQLRELQSSFTNVLYFTEPRPAAAANPEATVDALYGALVSRTTPGRAAGTWGTVLDGVVGKMRRWGYEVERGAYVQDVQFDAVVGEKDGAVIDVFAFGSTAKRWRPVEEHAGHFLFGLNRIDRQGLAVVTPPAASSTKEARSAHRRVTSWFNDYGCPVAAPDTLIEVASSLIGEPADTI